MLRLLHRQENCRDYLTRIIFSSIWEQIFLDTSFDHLVSKSD